MSSIRLERVSKQYGNKIIIDDLNLTVEDGSFTVLLGPSGCGKSTTLRMIAGLEQPTGGEINIDGASMDGIEPGQRGVAMVFQNYALYPTMTARKNIEYGLKNNKIPKPERDRLITEITETVGLTDHLHKKPQFLSGGERQRVALARAMVKKPKVFLMDEPLSNLDATLRQQLRKELIELHNRLKATFLYVTHDQVEAMSMGTKIVLMNEGTIIQEDSPYDIYHQPNSIFTSRFIGSPPMNLLPTVDLPTLPFPIPDGTKELAVRPERVRIASPNENNSNHNTEDCLTLQGTILTKEILGAEVLYTLETAGGIRIIVRQYMDEPSGNVEIENRISESSPASVVIKREHLLFFDSRGQRIKEPQVSEKQEVAI